MFADWFEVSVILLILAGIAFAVWKGGAANPVGTAGLKAAVDDLKGKFTVMQRDVKRIDGKVAELDKHAATTADIDRLRGEIAVMRETMARIDSRTDAMAENAAARGEAVDRIGRQVDRLYDIITQKGLSQ